MPKKKNNIKILSEKEFYEHMEILGCTCYTKIENGKKVEYYRLPSKKKLKKLYLQHVKSIEQDLGDPWEKIYKRPNNLIGGNSKLCYKWGREREGSPLSPI